MKSNVNDCLGWFLISVFVKFNIHHFVEVTMCKSLVTTIHFRRSNQSNNPQQKHHQNAFSIHIMYLD